MRVQLASQKRDRKRVWGRGQTDGCAREWRRPEPCVDSVWPYSRVGAESEHLPFPCALPGQPYSPSFVQPSRTHRDVLIRRRQGRIDFSRTASFSRAGVPIVGELRSPIPPRQKMRRHRVVPRPPNLIQDGPRLGVTRSANESCLSLFQPVHLLLKLLL